MSPGLNSGRQPLRGRESNERLARGTGCWALTAVEPSSHASSEHPGAVHSASSFCWKMGFARQVLSTRGRRALSARPASMQRMLDLDAHVDELCDLHGIERLNGGRGRAIRRGGRGDTSLQIKSQRSVARSPTSSPCTRSDTSSVPAARVRGSRRRRPRGAGRSRMRSSSRPRLHAGRWGGGCAPTSGGPSCGNIAAGPR